MICKHDSNHLIQNVYIFHFSSMNQLYTNNQFSLIQPKQTINFNMCDDM